MLIETHNGVPVNLDRVSIICTEERAEAVINAIFEAAKRGDGVHTRNGQSLQKIQ